MSEILCAVAFLRLIVSCPSQCQKASATHSPVPRQLVTCNKVSGRLGSDIICKDEHICYISVISGSRAILSPIAIGRGRGAQPRFVNLLSSKNPVLVSSENNLPADCGIKFTVLGDNIHY